MYLWLRRLRTIRRIGEMMLGLFFSQYDEVIHIVGKFFFFLSACCLNKVFHIQLAVLKSIRNNSLWSSNFSKRIYWTIQLVGTEVPGKRRNSSGHDEIMTLGDWKSRPLGSWWNFLLSVIALPRCICVLTLFTKDTSPHISVFCMYYTSSVFRISRY